MNYVITLFAQFLAVMLVISFHEFAHAYAAFKCGDPTAKFAGRMTLNPAKHFDMLGIVMFAVAGFGWAKPVPFNPYNFKNYKRGSFITSIAGVLINYAMAFVFYPILILVINYALPFFAGKYMAGFIYAFFYSIFAFSVRREVFSFSNFCTSNLARRLNFISRMCFV